MLKASSLYTAVDDDNKVGVEGEAVVRIISCRCVECNNVCDSDVTGCI